jgi:hypothetical protein
MQKKWSLILIVLMTFVSTPMMASIIKKPPAKPTETPYKELVCTEQDKAYIYEIISTMAEYGKIHLIFKQSQLKEMGAQINHVHPLKFLSSIFSDSYLKSCMAHVWADYFKKNGFLDGLAPSLTRESEKGKLTQYLSEFAKEVGVKEESLRPYFEARDWENLVLFLIQS